MNNELLSIYQIWGWTIHPGDTIEYQQKHLNKRTGTIKTIEKCRATCDRQICVRRVFLTFESSMNPRGAVCLNKRMYRFAVIEKQTTVVNKAVII